jgi:hypothetical protein
MEESSLLSDFSLGSFALNAPFKLLSVFIHLVIFYSTDANGYLFRKTISTNS